MIYFCTAQQQSGGVAWIARYDRQASSFLAAREKPGDRMPLAGGLRHFAGVECISLSGQPSVLLCLMPALAGAGLYLLGRMLGGVPLLTALSAAGVAVSPDLHPAAGPFVVAVILFYRWMSLPGDAVELAACLGAANCAAGAPADLLSGSNANAIGGRLQADASRAGLCFLLALLGEYLVYSRRHQQLAPRRWRSLDATLRQLGLGAAGSQGSRPGMALAAPPMTCL